MVRYATAEEIKAIEKRRKARAEERAAKNKNKEKEEVE